MRSGALLCLLAVAACGSDFQVPALPDARIAIDLAVTSPEELPDLGCFNRACGGCSRFARSDGTPAQVGDPCLWKGQLICNGATLTCSDASCPSCGGTMRGTVCGADGHTIVELIVIGSSCTAYDLGSAVGVCNDGPRDGCVDRCTKNGTTYSCVAGCLADDGGATGCAQKASDTCDSLTSC
jgi:hypothetical protein